MAVFCMLELYVIVCYNCHTVLSSARYKVIQASVLAQFTYFLSTLIFLCMIMYKCSL